MFQKLLLALVFSAGLGAQVTVVERTDLGAFITFGFQAQPSRGGAVAYAHSPFTQAQETYTISGDGRHVLAWAASGSRFVLHLDGKPIGEEFDQILPFQERTGDSKRERPRFLYLSGDGKRYAARARKGAAEYLIMDGVQKEAPQSRLAYFGFSSGDARYFAHFVARDTQAGDLLIVDGKPQSGFTSFRSPMFSENGVGFAFIGMNKENGFFAVVNGKAGAGFRLVEELRLSADGKHSIYAAAQGLIWRVFVDGVAQAHKFDQVAIHLLPPVSQIQIARDGLHTGYVFRQVNQESGVKVYFDGKAGNGYVDVQKLRLSPDGRRFGYIGSVNLSSTLGYVAVVDGKESVEYPVVSDWSFSADSAHTVFLGNTRSGDYAIVDGKEYGQSRGGGGVLVAAPAGPNVAYSLKSDDNFVRAYTTGQAGPDLAAVEMRMFEFSPDGRRYGYGGRKVSQHHVSVLDDEIIEAELQPFVHTQRRQTYFAFSADSSHVAFPAVQKPGLPPALFLDGKATPIQGKIAMPTFNPNGSSFAVAIQEGHQWNVVVNGARALVVDAIYHEFPETMHFRGDGKLEILASIEKRIVRVLIDPGSSSIAGFDAAQPMASPATGNSSNLPGRSSRQAGSTQAPTSPTPSQTKDPIEEMKEKAKKRLRGIFKQP